MSLTLLNSADEWTKYCHDFSQSLNLVSPDQISYGPGPAKYPVLVCSARVSPNRVLSAYIFVEDALKLIEAAGFVWGKKTAETPTQMDYNRHQAAMTLTLVQTLIEARLTTEEAFERKMQANLAAVDRYEGDQREKINKAIEGAGTVLGRLIP